MPCPVCGAAQPLDASFCVDCGARLTPIETDQSLKLSFFSLLLTIPAISVLALGSCTASLAVIVGVVLLDWKIVATGAGFLIGLIALSQLLHFLSRKP